MRASETFTVTLGLGLILAVSLFSGAAAALPSDRQQAIEIEAGSAMREERQGLIVYEQDVTIRQGSIRINADRVSVHTAGSDVDKIIARGRPARYQQQLNPGEPPVMAHANSIEYLLGSDIIQLIGDASLEQDGSTLSGSRIDYDLKQEIIRASGNSGDGGRIRMVIPPNQQPDTQPAATPEPATPSEESTP